MKTVQIKQLGYKIYTKDISKSKVHVPNRKLVMYFSPIDYNSSEIWIPKKITKFDIPTLAHEVVHILQHISKVRGIDFINEEEHFGYLMQFILNEILDYEYMS